MAPPSWERVDSESESPIEANWLFELRRERFRSRLTGLEHHFYVMNLADAVQVITLTPDRKLVMVRQFRAGSKTDSLEPPGGLLNPHESVLTAAARELLEETGYVGDPPRLLGQAWSNPSIMSSKISTVVITNAQKRVDTTLDHGEEVELELIPAQAVPLMIRDGKIDHALAAWGLMLWMAVECPENRIAQGYQPAKSRFGIGPGLRLFGLAGGLAGLGYAGCGLLRSDLVKIESLAPLWVLACGLGALTAWIGGERQSPVLIGPKWSNRILHTLMPVVGWSLIWFIVVIALAIVIPKLDLANIFKRA